MKAFIGLVLSLLLFIWFMMFLFFAQMDAEVKSFGELLTECRTETDLSSFECESLVRARLGLHDIR